MTNETISPFRYLDIETCSSCNRVCPTCIRNSHPDRQEIASWFTPNYLSEDVIKEALEQCKQFQFPIQVCLSHSNEPLMDKRLPDLVRLVKSYGFYVFFNTNGDFLTEKLAKEFDGTLDRMIVSLYMDEPIKSQRAAWMRTLFKKTDIQPNTVTDHVPTHYSPKFDVKALAEQNRGYPCFEAEMRVIINHRRQYLLCCNDVVGNFGLGTFPEIGIEDFWFGEPHKTTATDLKHNGGRLKYSHCYTCPRR